MSSQHMKIGIGRTIESGRLGLNLGFDSTIGLNATSRAWPWIRVPPNYPAPATESCPKVSRKLEICPAGPAGFTLQSFVDQFPHHGSKLTDLTASLQRFGSDTRPGTQLSR